MKYYNYTNKLLKLSKQFKKTASELYKFAEFYPEELGLLLDRNNGRGLRSYGTALQTASDRFRQESNIRAQQDFKNFFEGLDWIDKLKLIFSKIFGVKSAILENYNKTYADKVRNNFMQYGSDLATRFAKEHGSNDLGLLRRYAMGTMGSEKQQEAISYINNVSKNRLDTFMKSQQKTEPYKSPTMNQRFTNFVFSSGDVNKEVSDQFNHNFNQATKIPQKNFTPQQIEAFKRKIIDNAPWPYQVGDALGFGSDLKPTNEEMNDLYRLDHANSWITPNKQLNQTNTTNNQTSNITLNTTPNVDIVKG